MREEEKKRERVSDEGGDMKDQEGGVREVRDPDPWKILWIPIRQNDADLLDQDLNPQHCLKLQCCGGSGISRRSIYFTIITFSLYNILHNKVRTSSVAQLL